mmetsp:Transcript_28000/g.75615  ORF Transcript_28000/g.75615 Transcript_28000/m.75615 type:complete len:214 (+) Transcript_28000:306-947(+)
MSSALYKYMLVHTCHIPRLHALVQKKLSTLRRLWRRRLISSDLVCIRVVLPDAVVQCCCVPDPSDVRAHEACNGCFVVWRGLGHLHCGSGSHAQHGCRVDKCHVRPLEVEEQRLPCQVEQQLDTIQRKREPPLTILVLPHQPRCHTLASVEHRPDRGKQPVWRRPTWLAQLLVPALDGARAQGTTNPSCSHRTTASQGQRKHIFLRNPHCDQY